MKRRVCTGFIVLFLVIAGCGRENHPKDADPAPFSGPMKEKTDSGGQSDDSLMKATFGMGCFWCGEALYERMKGVKNVVSGYAGGHVEDPTYEQVSTGNTGHAEVLQITYDPETVSYEDLLEVFWQMHNPTTKDRQGPDVGPQYRSIILYHGKEQKRIADVSKKAIEEAEVWEDPVVTELKPLDTFYPAESYHQDFYRRNPKQGYCRMVIRPKLQKFRELFREKLKER